METIVEDSIDRVDESGVEGFVSCDRLIPEALTTTTKKQKLDPGFRRGDGSLPFAISQEALITGRRLAPPRIKP